MVSGRASPNSPGLPPGRADPDRIETLAEFAEALDLLRGSRSYADLGRAAKSTTLSGGRRPALPRSTLSDLLRGKSVPGRATVIVFLTACDLDADAQQPWLAAFERVATSHLRRPPGAVRVRQARPRLLGVHAAIRVAGADSELPPYVPRDVDADLRMAVTAAAASGGFVLLIGGSSVGKTRALLESVRAVVPDWWLLHPADTPALRVFADQPATRTVVWLDELQRYLDHPGGLPVGALRALAGAGVVVVATLWPNEYGTARGFAAMSTRPAQKWISRRVPTPHPRAATTVDSANRPLQSRVAMPKTIDPAGVPAVPGGVGGSGNGPRTAADPAARRTGALAGTIGPTTPAVTTTTDPVPGA